MEMTVSWLPSQRPQFVTRVFSFLYLYIFVAKLNQTLKTVTANMNHTCCLQTPTYIFWIWTLGLNENQERFHKKGRSQKILCIIFITVSLIKQVN